MISKTVQGAKIYLWSVSHSSVAGVVSVQIGPAVDIEDPLRPIQSELEMVIIDDAEYQDLVSLHPGFTERELLAFAIKAPAKKQKRLRDEVKARQTSDKEIRDNAIDRRKERDKTIAADLEKQIEASRLRQIKRESDDAKRHAKRKADRLKRKKDRAAAQAIIDQAEKDNPKAHH